MDHAQEQGLWTSIGYAEARLDDLEKRWLGTGYIFKLALFVSMGISFGIMSAVFAVQTWSEFKKKPDDPIVIRFEAAPVLLPNYIIPKHAGT